MGDADAPSARRERRRRRWAGQPRSVRRRSASAAEDAVTRIDLESGERSGAPIQVGSKPGAVAVGETAVWVADNGEGAITRIEP